MNPNSFFENFFLLAETPNGIQKLREMILQMAVQGKLVPQNPDDEPAEVLLEKIRKEKKIKKSKESSEIDVPFDIPVNWQWSLLDDISDKVHYGYTASADETIKDVKLLRITDIQNNKVNWDTVPGCQIENEKIESYSLSNGDLLIARTGGTIGKSYLVEHITICSVFASYLIRIVPSSFILPRYLKVFTESPLYWKQLYSKCSGTGQPNVNGTALRSLVTPLPPLEEQKRIVTKVDQLMELCDQLEFLQQKKHESRIHLNNAALNKMLDAGSPEEFADNWRLVCDNFGLLYDNLENVEKLRQAILQLAVMGKLVEQDDGDEPAEVLLEKIAIKNKNEKNLFSPKSNEYPFEIPTSWKWVKLSDIVDSRGITYGIVKMGAEDSKGVLALRCSNVKFRRLDLHNVRTVTTQISNKYKRTIIQGGELLMTIRGTLGGCAIAPEYVKGYNIAREIALIPLIKEINNEYMLNVISSPYIQEFNVSKTRGIAYKGLNLKTLADFLIPLPPLAEQKRIVAKVDQLMELCYRLESNIRQAQENGERLMEAAVSGLLGGS
ncbi:restriction endonuclease subunit S [Methanolobus bombayensis]|uniref:restriction endonuclease subunit S n=1 Tax=Methanolobus bombayensis TaxID=38023 RepID=UPI001AEAEB75|nr:restriction endonuclease subunit S [Methanolobus bombayensis]MBP1909683.1 type I restriction enzyme S subunit [Methanolobus bombayensis]